MIWFTLLLLISAKADEACEKKIGKIAELACSKKPLDIGKAEIKLSEEAKGFKEKQRKANIEEMVGAYKKKIRSLERPNENFLLFLSLAKQETKKGRLPSDSLLYLEHWPNDAPSHKSNFEKDKAALEACIETKKAHRNIRVPESCANLLAQVLTERAHRKLFYNQEYKDYNSGDLELEVKLRENSLYKEVLKSQRNSIISENNKIYEKFDETIEATLVDVKKTMKDFIKPRIIQNEKVRKRMQDRIERIKFGGSCLPKGSDTVKPLFIKSAFYNPRTETFTYCRGMVDGRRISEYQLVRTISHELAHSIEPCLIQFDFRSNSDDPIINYEGSDNPERIYPFSIIECLRSEDSIQAFRPNYRPYPHYFYSMYYDTQNTPYNPHPHPHPPSRPSRPPPPFCHDKDQINESFCDWLASEILSRHMNSNLKLSGNDKNQHINGVASIFRPFCNPQDGLGTSRLGQDIGPHSMSIDRLERIILAHPGIRRKLCGKNVKSEVKYCPDFRNLKKDMSKNSNLQALGVTTLFF